MTPPTQPITIYTAIAAPGSGKTEALLSQAPKLIKEGKRILLALPTLVLSDEIVRRAYGKGITCWRIDHRSGEPVISGLEQTLVEKAYVFVICTQESLRRVKATSVQGWTLILDELPKVVDYPDWTLNSTELERVLQYTEEVDGQLWIPASKTLSVQEQITTHRADTKGIDCSTLGQSAAHIFRLLLSRVNVFIDAIMPNGKRHVRAVEEYHDWWNILSSASECHVLAASIKNSEFETFALIRGFRFSDSELTPQWRPESNRVTIYPVVPKGQKFSWRMMTAKHDDERLIDIILTKILKHATTAPLLFANNWAGFKYTPGVIYVPKDCRGLNGYTHATEAAVLFGGNPSPSDGKGLEYLKEKYGIDFEPAFITTRLLEPSLQAVTRTAVRCKENIQPINLYVQDYRVAEYLSSTYFPDAKIDWSIANVVPAQRDGRKLDISIESEVVRLLSLGLSNAQINRTTNVSRQKIKKIKESHLVT